MKTRWHDKFMYMKHLYAAGGMRDTEPGTTVRSVLRNIISHQNHMSFILCISQDLHKLTKSCSKGGKKVEDGGCCVL
jgi:hypothetical protein